MSFPKKKANVGPVGKKQEMRMTGGPYDGKYLYLRTHGTLEFSVTVNVQPHSTIKAAKMVEFKGYYDHNNTWVNTLNN